MHRIHIFTPQWLHKANCKNLGDLRVLRWNAECDITQSLVAFWTNITKGVESVGDANLSNWKWAQTVRLKAKETRHKYCTLVDEAVSPGLRG